MRCAWDTYIKLLPIWMRDPVDRMGRDCLQELRLRIGVPPELITESGSLWLSRTVSREDLNFCMNAASQYSPWASETLSMGYITAQGGHRIGICGIFTWSDRQACGIREITSLCLRVARDFTDLTKDFTDHNTSVLIIGKPGSGKTTLLRDFIRQRSNQAGQCVCVVDEKGELFPSIGAEFCFPAGKRTDVLTGYGKTEGIEMVLRNMCPDTIAVDEITAHTDCEALLHAGWCGVKLLATAHAESRKDLFMRPVYRPIIESKLFDTLIVLRRDKTWRLERMNG